MLTGSRDYVNQPPETRAALWRWIVVLPFVSVVAAGVLVLLGWIGLALLGY
jgi:hypothetical protein